MKLTAKIFFAMLFLYVIVYAAFLLNSVKNIDRFCNDISNLTRIIDISKLADKHNVNLRGPREYGKIKNHFIITAASPFTLNQYACRIETDGFHVVSKSLGSK